MDFEYFEHTADMGLRARAETLEKLFINMAIGIINYITELTKIKPEKKTTIKVTGLDMENLLVNWLKGILLKYNLDDFLTRDLKFLNFDSENFLIEAELTGDDNLINYEINGEIKNITYHNLSIKKEGNYFKASIIFDV